MNPLNPTGAAAKKPPTQKHTAAIWESMLGTVCAADREGNPRYFDYDYAAAVEYADLNGCDLRVAKYGKSVRGSGVPYPHGPRRGQIVLWRRIES